MKTAERSISALIVLALIAYTMMLHYRLDSIQSQMAQNVRGLTEIDDANIRSIESLTRSIDHHTNAINLLSRSPAR